MKVYNVTITSTDMTQVNANSEDEAINIATDIFLETPNNNAEYSVELVGEETEVE